MAEACVKYIPFAKYDRVVRRLRKLLRSDDVVVRRDALAIVLGLHGLRVTEVAQLAIADLDAIDEMLTVRTLKRGKPRRVALGAGVYRELRKMAGRRAKGGPLFVTSTGQPVAARWWQVQARRVLAELLGGAGLRFHALRHTYAMRLYHETKDMQRVKARLGHRSLHSTQVYVDAYGELDDRELRKVGRIAVLPSLRSERREAQEARGKKRSAPREKTGKSLGPQQDSAEIVRAKHVPTTNGRQKSEAQQSGDGALRIWMGNALKDLRQEEERLKRLG